MTFAHFSTVGAEFVILILTLVVLMAKGDVSLSLTDSLVIIVMFDTHCSFVYRH